MLIARGHKMRVFVRYNGFYVGVEPGFEVVYANRSAGGAWELLELTHRPDGTVSLLFVEANRQLSLTDRQELQVRPAGWVGEWEKFTLVQKGEWYFATRNGISLALEGYQAAPSLKQPAIQGLDFVQDGKRVVLKGTDQFCAYRRWLDHGASALESLLKESNELGFDTWRVFMTGSNRQNNILELSHKEPGYYDQVPLFEAHLERNGVRGLLCAYVDNQDIKATLDHWKRLGSLLGGSKALLSGGNEWQKNGWSPSELSAPTSGIWWSRGSGTGDAAPVTPYGSFAEFHPVRHMPTMLYDSVASPVFLQTKGLNVPLVIDEPIGFAEADKPGSRTSDPKMAYRLARHYSTECAGAVFHNDNGMRCQPIVNRIRECALAWQEGMKL